MARETAPIMTTPVEQCEAPKMPAVLVRCHCPRNCWANRATLELMDQDGCDPDFYCLQCAPEPMRSSAEFIMSHRRELGIEEGTPLRVDVEEVKPKGGMPPGWSPN